MRKVRVIRYRHGPVPPLFRRLFAKPPPLVTTALVVADASDLRGYVTRCLRHDPCNLLID